MYNFSDNLLIVDLVSVLCDIQFKISGCWTLDDDVTLHSQELKQQSAGESIIEIIIEQQSHLKSLLILTAVSFYSFESLNKLSSIQTCALRVCV